MEPGHGEPGHELTAWTIRLALIAYVVAVYLEFPRPCPDRPLPLRYRAAKALWTLGLVLFFGHLVAAFHYYHHWSHARAWTDTARQTRDLIGWAFGDGIFFSYLFAAVWLADVVWWYGSPGGYLRRPAWISLAVHGYLAFIAFNGAVVFESGATRWAGLIVTPPLIWITVRRWLHARRLHARRSAPSEPEPA